MLNNDFLRLRRRINARNETFIGPWKEYVSLSELRPLLFHEAYFRIGVSEPKLSGTLVEK